MERNQDIISLSSSDRRKRKTLVAILTFLFLGIIVVFGLNFKNIGRGPALYETKPIATETINAQLPPDLIPEKDVVIDQSFKSIDEANKVSQISATYISAQSMQWNVIQFSDYLVSNRWTVGRVGDANELPVTFFYATKDNHDLNITLNFDGERAHVSIAYTTK